MQTFLPYPSAAHSARVLDDARLRKQGQEAAQIVRTLLGLTAGYQHHPAVTMWRGAEGALGWYTSEIGRECRRRGFAASFDTEVFGLLYRAGFMVARQPWWMGDRQFHLAHQSALVRKLPRRYGPHFPFAPTQMPYLWPTDKGTFRLSKPDIQRIKEGELVAWPTREP